MSRWVLHIGGPHDRRMRRVNRSWRAYEIWLEEPQHARGRYLLERFVYKRVAIPVYVWYGRTTGPTIGAETLVIEAIEDARELVSQAEQGDQQAMEAPKEAPDKLWAVFDTAWRMTGAYTSPREAGKNAGWGAAIVGYAHGMDEESYRRGWSDALGDAAKLADRLTHGDDLLRGLGRAILELTPAEGPLE